MFKPRLIAHAGAWSIPFEFELAHEQGLHAALTAVYPKLASGEYSAMDAVTEVVCHNWYKIECNSLCVNNGRAF